jgi:hypothetical protein
MRAAPPPVIAIDGPTASGKGTVAAGVAAALDFHYLDSGALYRVVALMALREGLAAALAEGREAIVLSGAPGRFSGGLDVPALLRLDRAGITEAWMTFFGLLRELASSPVPIIAALTGHSPAGGTVLALFAVLAIRAARRVEEPST